MYLPVTIVTYMFIITSYGYEEVRRNHSLRTIIITDETRLHNKLFYINRLPHPTHQRLNVNFGLSLISVVDFDASNEAIIIIAFIRQLWNNPVISWNPDDYGGIKKINVKSTKTWTPDIYAYGNVETQFKYNGFLNTLKTEIIISFDGNHTWLAPIIMKLGCGMNVADFPFDTQTCPFLFGSFTYDQTKLNLIPEHAHMKNYVRKF